MRFMAFDLLSGQKITRRLQVFDAGLGLLKSERDERLALRL